MIKMNSDIHTTRIVDRGANGLMVIVVRNGHRNQSSNYRWSCFSHSINTLQKGMHPTILPSDI